jgi:hypothetical protein
MKNIFPTRYRTRKTNPFLEVIGGRLKPKRKKLQEEETARGDQDSKKEKANRCRKDTIKLGGIPVG